MSSNPDTQLLEEGTDRFPVSLKAVLGKSAPTRLYCIGNLKLLELPGVGFCGSRKASEKGLQTTEDCSAQAAKDGIVVISGNAAGVDFRAHYRALADGGSTILVLPEGIDHFRIRKALRDVWDWNRVLVVSQFDPKTPWRAYHAMARNKVILGLSQAMIVVEAGSTGGTLDAGKSTLAANMPLFVVEYGDANPDASGNKILIEMGGVPLNRLRSTQRANMQKVWDAFEDPNASRLQKKLL